MFLLYLKDMTPIPRQHYLDQLYHVFGKDLIIVLVGERRVGKSLLLRMLRDRLLEQPDAHVIFVDKEKKEVHPTFRVMRQICRA